MCKAIDDMILEGKQEGIQEGLRASIEMAKELGATKELVIKQIEKRFRLSQEEALDAINKYYA